MIVRSLFIYYKLVSFFKKIDPNQSGLPLGFFLLSFLNPFWIGSHLYLNNQNIHIGPGPFKGIFLLIGFILCLFFYKIKIPEKMKLDFKMVICIILNSASWLSMYLFLTR